MNIKLSIRIKIRLETNTGNDLNKCIGKSNCNKGNRGIGDRFPCFFHL